MSPIPILAEHDSSTSPDNSTTVVESGLKNVFTPESDIEEPHHDDLQNWNPTAIKLKVKVTDKDNYSIAYDKTDSTERSASVVDNSEHPGSNTVAIPAGTTKRPKTWENETYTDYKSPKLPLRVNPPRNWAVPNCGRSPLVTKGNVTANNPTSYKRSLSCMPTFCGSNNCDRYETTKGSCISNIFAEPDGVPNVKNNMHRHDTIQAKKSIAGGQALQYLLQLMDGKLPCPIGSQCSSHYECRFCNALLKCFMDYWRKYAVKDDVSNEACCTQPCSEKKRNFLMALTDDTDQNEKWIPNHGGIPDFLLQFLCEMRKNAEDQGNRRFFGGESSSDSKINPRACASDDHQITPKLALCASDTPEQISDETYNPPKQLSISGSPGRTTVETDKADSIIPKYPVKVGFHSTAFHDEVQHFTGSRMGNGLGDTNKSDEMEQPKISRLSSRVEECEEVPGALLVDRSRESGLQQTPTNVLEELRHKDLQRRGAHPDKPASNRPGKLEQPDTQDNQVRIRVQPEKPPNRSAVPLQRKQSGFSAHIKRNRTRSPPMVKRRMADVIPAYHRFLAKRFLAILFHSTVLGRVASVAQLPIRQPHVAPAGYGFFLYVGVDKAQCFPCEGALLSWMWDAQEPNHRSHFSKCKRILEPDTSNVQKDCQFSEYSRKRTQKAKLKTFNQRWPMMLEVKTDFHPAGGGGLVDEDDPSLDQVKLIPGTAEDPDLAHSVVPRQDDSPLGSDSKPRVSRKPPEDMRDEKGNAIKNGKGIQLLPDGGKQALTKDIPGRIASGQSRDKNNWTSISDYDTITAKAFVCHENAEVENGAPAADDDDDNEDDPNNNVPEEPAPQASAQAPRPILPAVALPQVEARLEDYEARLRTFEDDENFWSHLNPGADRLARAGWYFYEQSIICHRCHVHYPITILDNKNLHSIALHRGDCQFRHVKLCTRCTENLESIGIDGEEGCCACGRRIYMRAFNEMPRTYFEPPADPEPRAFCNHQCVICSREMDYAPHHDTCARCSRQICDDCVMERRFHQC